MRIRFALAGALFLAAPAPSRADEPSSAVVYDVDPRVELVSVVQALARPRGYERGVGEARSARFKQIARRFRRMRRHPIVPWYRRWKERGEPEVLLVEYALHLSRPPEFKLDATPADELIERLGGPQEASRFQELLADFAEKSGFMARFAEDGEVHAVFVEKARAEAARGADPAAVEAYFGVPFPKRLRVSVGTLFEERGRLSASRQLPLDKELVLAQFMDETGGYRLGEYWNSPSHALAHTHSEAWSRSFGPEIERELGAPPASCPGDYAAPDWTGCLDEHVVSAVMLRLERAALGDKRYLDELARRAREENTPFLDAVCRSLEDYERERARYPTLQDYFPRLAAALREAAKGRRLPPADAPAIVERPIRFTAVRIEATRTYLKDRYGIDAPTIDIAPRIIVVHWTAIASTEGSWAAFDPELLSPARPELAAGGAVNVSAHFLVDRQGKIFKLMPETWMARHVIGLNHCAIGIENVGGAGGKDDLTDAQLDANVRIIRELKSRHPGIGWLIGHHEYRSFEGHALWKEKDAGYRTEKSDPGERVMTRLRRGVAGLGLAGPPTDRGVPGASP